MRMRSLGGILEERTEDKTAEQWGRKNQPTKPRQAHEETLNSNSLATGLISLGRRVVWRRGLSE